MPKPPDISFHIPKAPRVPSGDLAPDGEREPYLGPRDTFSDVVGRAAVHLAERVRAQIVHYPSYAIDAQTAYLHGAQVDSLGSP